MKKQYCNRSKRYSPQYGVIFSVDCWQKIPQRGPISISAVVAVLLSALAASQVCAASIDRVPITERHTGLTREAAAEEPRSEDQQAIINGWPLYRTERGQEAFNHAMATLRATDGPSPGRENFKGCEDLRCRLILPQLTPDGWIPAGRIWVSPDEYVLVAHSPRRSNYDPGNRRSSQFMRYFVFHEFRNSNGNTDLYDTISAHSRSIFVPFYLGKPELDAKGRQYVVLVQVAPHNVVSRHAAVFGNAGPGIEVAKNQSDPLPRLQALGGILVATIVGRAEPRLRMVHHRNTEGLPMLRAYQQRLAALTGDRSSAAVRLPFRPIKMGEVARATGSLHQLVARGGALAQVRRQVPLVVGRVSAASSEGSMFAAPRLLQPPHLIHALRRPALTMEKLLESILAPPVPPKPELVR